MKVLTLVLTWLFVLSLCFNSYANDAEDLIRAAWKGDAETVRELLAKGVDVNSKVNYGGTALIFASSEGHLEVVQDLLAKGADVNAKTDNGVTALMQASQSGHLEVAQELLLKGADANAKTTDDGTTALIWASHYGYLDIVKALLTKVDSKTDSATKVADVNAKANNGATALIAASNNGYLDIVRELLAKGADASAKVNDGTTALSLAKEKKVCSDSGFCYCKSIAAVVIIILVWTMPDPKIWVTVFAALIILGSGYCVCRKKGLVKSRFIGGSEIGLSPASVIGGRPYLLYIARNAES